MNASKTSYKAVVIRAYEGICLVCPITRVKKSHLADITRDMIYIRPAYKQEKGNYKILAEKITAVSTERLSGFYGYIKREFPWVTRRKVLEYFSTKISEEYKNAWCQTIRLNAGEDIEMYDGSFFETKKEDVNTDTCIKAGDVVMYDFSFSSIGAEIKKIRYCLVMWINEDGTALVVPISTRIDEKCFHQYIDDEGMIYSSKAEELGVKIEGNLFFEQARNNVPVSKLYNKAGSLSKDFYQMTLMNMFNVIKGVSHMPTEEAAKWIKLIDCDG